MPKVLPWLLFAGMALAALYAANPLIFSPDANPAAECVARKQLPATDPAKAVRPTECVPVGQGRSTLLPAPPVTAPSPQLAEVTAAPDRADTSRAHGTDPAVAPAAAVPVELPAVGTPQASPVSRDRAHYDWAEISRAGAYVHAGPSVEAAITSIYPIGKQLRILSYTNGWVQLQDAEGGSAGWVYEKYVASISSPNAQRQTVAEAQAQPPSPVSHQPPLGARAPLQTADVAPPEAVSGPAPRWALGYGESGRQASVETRGDRPAQARPHNPNLADLYLRQFYRGY
jgi:Bacterial SH3 domain